MGILGTPPVVAGIQVDQTSTTEKHPLGTVVLHKDSSGNVSLIKFVRSDNATISQHLCVKQSVATSVSDYVVVTATGDGGNPAKILGVTAATLATNAYGWVYCGGYVPGVKVSSTVASTDILMLSGSVAGNLVVPSPSFNATVVAHEATSLFAVAIARDAASNAAASTAKIQLFGSLI